jgi:LysR family transcriptional regulator, cyn operon transcriptional activator
MQAFSYSVQDRFIIVLIGRANSLSAMLLRHIRYFLAVARHRNFTRAAEALHVSQPTLSQQIKQLEDTLRVQLLDRSGRTVRLTDSGTAYMRYAVRALQDLEAGKRAIHDVQDLSLGALRLAMTPTFTTYLIGPLIDKFNERYPNILLGIREMAQERMEVLLNEDELDVGIAFTETQSPEIETQVLLVEVLSLVVGRAHPHARRRTPLTLRDFERETLVLLNEEFATRRYIDHYCRQQGVAPVIAIEVNSIGAVLEIVRRDRLSTLLPEAIARENRELCAVRLEPALPQRTAALLWRKGAYRSAAARAFVELALERSRGT